MVVSAIHRRLPCSLPPTSGTRHPEQTHSEGRREASTTASRISDRISGGGIPQHSRSGNSSSGGNAPATAAAAVAFLIFWFSTSSCIFVVVVIVVVAAEEYQFLSKLVTTSSAAVESSYLDAQTSVSIARLRCNRRLCLAGCIGNEDCG